MSDHTQQSAGEPTSWPPLDSRVELRVRGMERGARAHGRLLAACELTSDDQQRLHAWLSGRGGPAQFGALVRLLGRLDFDERRDLIDGLHEIIEVPAPQSSDAKGGA